MKFLIIILAIALNLTAETKQSSEKIFKPGNQEYNTEIGNFLRELQKEWNEINKNIKPNTRFEMTFSDEQAQIDIAKAELQKIYLKFRKQGKFKKNTEIKSEITKEDIN